MRDANLARDWARYLAHHWRDLPDIPTWLANVGIVAAAVVAAILLHALAFALLARAARRGDSEGGAAMVERTRGLARWILVAVALASIQPLLHLTRGQATLWGRVAGLVIPGLVGWFAVVTLGNVVDILSRKADISVEDNLRARRRRTRLGILQRIGAFVIVLVTICLMLMSIPSVRALGVTLAASAGVAGIAVGAAAQPALKNLIAGIQMAFTEPIRLDDVVIVDGEWGRVEEIRLTYVVIKVWDERRLVVPVSKFLEDSFQNWTRQSAKLMGSVFWYLDPAADVARLRERAGAIITANPRWDGRFWNLQVTDTKPDGSIELRGLMTAKDASTAFDLRCDVREALLDYIKREMPEAILRRRADVSLTPPLSPAPSPPAAPA